MKIFVGFIDSCKECQLNFNGICAGSYYGVSIEKLSVCSDYKISLEVFNTLVPKNFTVTNWDKTKSGFVFYGYQNDI